MIYDCFCSLIDILDEDEEILVFQKQIMALSSSHKKQTLH
jgi:hypothetical protein